jgi:hypothetical protein
MIWECIGVDFLGSVVRIAEQDEMPACDWSLSPKISILRPASHYSPLFIL